MATTNPHITRSPVTPNPLIGRDELNLAEFPIALLADRAPKGQKTLHFEDGHGRLTVTGSDEYGLPTPVDADVIVALIYLTKQRTNFRDVEVNFSRYELIKLLKWADEGKNYKRLQLSLNRWHGVSLIYDKCWWDNRQKQHVSANMHILESVIYAAPGGNPRDGRGESSLSTFTWNKTFIESCQADNLRQLDLDTYFSLKSAVSKRLYRFLGKRFHLRGDWTFDLNEIAFDRVGLSRGYEGDAGKIKEKLRPAIDELEAIGFLGPAGRDDRYRRVDRGRWTIRLARGRPAVAGPPPPSAPPEAAEASPPALVDELVKRGVKPKVAADLAGRHPAAYVAGKIEQFDWEMTRARPPKKPAGYLVKSIVDDYDADPAFVSKAERDRREGEERQAERDAAEGRRRKRAEEARRREERRQEDAYWSGLTPAARAELDARALAEADESSRETYLSMKRAGSGGSLLALIRRDYIRALIDAEGLAGRPS